MRVLKPTYGGVYPYIRDWLNILVVSQDMRNSILFSRVKFQIHTTKQCQFIYRYNYLIGHSYASPFWRYFWDGGPIRAGVKKTAIKRPKF